MLRSRVGYAVKSPPDRGEIRSAAVRLDGTVEISVADDGIGIAPQDQERVFQGFQQGDSSMGRQHAGTGLGLTLTRRFANLHGGALRVESQLEEGRVFTVPPPVETRRTAGATPPQSSGQGESSATD